MKIYSILIIGVLAIQNDLFAAEAGMPQLDPKYWPSQAFWLILVFSLLYVAISKLFIPKIKNNLDDRDNKIKSDLDQANELKSIAEKKQKEYELVINNANKEVLKIIFENKKKLNLDIQSKKREIEKNIQLEIDKAQKEIIILKKNSLNDVIKISEEIASKIIEEISGEKINESSVKAAVSESSKKNLTKFI